MSGQSQHLLHVLLKFMRLAQIHNIAPLRGSDTGPLDWEYDALLQCRCMEAGQLGLIPTRPVSQLGLGLTRPLIFSITGGVFYKCMMLLDMNNDLIC